MCLANFHKCSKVEIGNGPAKAMLLTISVMDGDRGCFASLGKLAEMLEFTKRTAINAMALLEHLELVSVSKKNGSKSTIKINEKVLDEYLTGERGSPVKEIHRCTTFTGPVKEVHRTGERGSPLKERKGIKVNNGEEDSQSIVSDVVALPIFQSEEKLADKKKPAAKSKDVRDADSDPLVIKRWRLVDYLKNRDLHQLPAIPADHRLFAKAEELGIPTEFISIAWNHFKARHIDKVVFNADWPSVFEKVLLEGGDGLFYPDPKSGEYKLSAKGMNAQAAANKIPTKTPVERPKLALAKPACVYTK